MKVHQLFFGPILFCVSLIATASAQPRTAVVEFFWQLELAVVAMNQYDDGDYTILVKPGMYNATNPVELEIHNPDSPHTKTIKAQDPNNRPVFTGPYRIRVRDTDNVVFDGLKLVRTHNMQEERQEANTEDELSGLVNISGDDQDSTDCSIMNCDFSETYNGDYWSQYVFIRGNRCDVYQCVFNKKTSHGHMVFIRVNEAAGQHQLEHKHYIHECQFLEMQEKTGVSIPDGIKSGSCIQMGNGFGDQSVDAQCEVFENDFISFDGALENEVISNKSSKNKYYKNEFWFCDGQLVIRFGHDCQIYRNRFELGTNGAIRIYGDRHAVYNNYVYNVIGNPAITLVGGKFEEIAAPGTEDAAEYCLIAFNTIINTTCSFGFLTFDGSQLDFPRNNIVAKNLLYQERHVATNDFIQISNFWNNSNGQAIADWTTNVWDRNLFNSDGESLLLVDSAHQVFYPDPTSPENLIEAEHDHWPDYVTGVYEPLSTSEVFDEAGDLWDNVFALPWPNVWILDDFYGTDRTGEEYDIGCHEGESFSIP